MGFVKAVKSKAKLRAAISGPSGSGKTFTALRIAKGIGGKIALIDSEFGSASKYADIFDFDVMDISANKHPKYYIEAIKAAESEGYDVVIVDSMTHAWDETKKEVDKKAQAMKNPNSYMAWAVGTKLWQDLEDTIMGSKIHVIVTMRAKTEYVQEKDERTGKTVPKKIGMAPEVRTGTEYAFDIVLDLNHEHTGIIDKTRCHELDGYCEQKPDETLGQRLAKWLDSGVEPILVPKRNEIETPYGSYNGYSDATDGLSGTVQVCESAAKIIKLVKEAGFDFSEFSKFLIEKKKINDGEDMRFLREDVAKTMIEGFENAKVAFGQWLIKHKHPARVNNV